MRVSEKMTSSPVTTTLDTPVYEAIEILEENHFRRLPVMDQDGKLVGIVTDKELQKAMPSQATSLSAHELNYILMKTKVGDILPKRKLVTIDADELLEEAAVLLRNHKIGAIPVIKNGNLVGIITETTIFDAFIEIMGLKEPGYRMEAYIKGNPMGMLGKVATIIGDNGGNISHVSADVKDIAMAKLTLRFSTDADVDSIVKELEAIDVQVNTEKV
ncbi:MAG: CBS domain-containing protein [Peptococcaceae bacterium]|jgi:acetoin utilization protein AcuB|nr:CBS domain-containing protein [Peptococcaceae bacterium]